jgi:hypothetical protein
MKSPTSYIFIKIDILVSMGISMKVVLVPCVVFGCVNGILLVFPCFQLLKEGISAGCGKDNLCLSESRTSGSKMARGMLMTYAAEVFWAIDLEMTFCLVIVTSDNGDVSTTMVNPGFFRLSTCRRWKRSWGGSRGQQRCSVFFEDRSGWRRT